ncbi:MAG: hypothetical protein CVV05_13805 [Gammaproteobacteria bacterium HGW-Gammaproteobacteria-1]|jgi:hypothetical protein|nr:MAG: hypothetical protein CVV05_13805 [Gammaproteobacteria bacterium HGW-Gammaproteobacteria-1]
MRRASGLTRGVLTVLVLWLAGCTQEQSSGTVPDDIERFLERHWQQPLPAQGTLPADYTAIEAALGPQACAQCHEAQWEQWRGSLHSHTMGAGIQWQLHLMDQEQGNRCLRCHAPLAEQKALVALQQGWPGVPKSPPPEHVPPDLADQGLVCAACHVRNHQRFGPPANKPVPEPVPHGGFVASAAFEDSRFCATCHQFAADGPRVNGKLQEDTYAQWQASPQAAQQSCQSCHMPDRRHLFRGVHDRDMVLQALQVSLDVQPGARPGEFQARAVMRNTGAGHHFPTYMVPKVDVVLQLVNAAGGARRTLAHRVIGWGVDVALSQELFDTRIPAGGELVVEQAFSSPGAGEWEVELRLDVAPREHYERMFQDSLRHADVLAPEVLALLRQALAEAKATRYEALRLATRLPR